MTDIMVRDVPDETTKSIELRARRAGASRQEFLKTYLTEAFDPKKRLDYQLANRLKILFDELESRNIKLPTIARLMGHESVEHLVRILDGEIVLPFETADRLCKVLGVCSDWLLTEDMSPYYQSPLFHDAPECLVELAQIDSRSAAPFSTLYFVLADEPDGKAAVFGVSSSANPLRYDLLLRDIPVSDNVGATGTGQLFDFALLCAAFHVKRMRGIQAWGRILDRKSFRDLTLGIVHPASLLMKSGHTHSAWIDDLWDLGYQGPDYTANFTAARKLFRLTASDKGIHTNQDLEKHITSRYRMTKE